MTGRAETIDLRRLTPAERRQLKAEAADYPQGHVRPRVRSDCQLGGPNAVRPCPWISCRHHLSVDVHESTGNVAETFPGQELRDMPDTCSLDAADRGGMTLEDVGARLNVTRERARQIEVLALKQIGKKQRAALLEAGQVGDGATQGVEGRAFIRAAQEAGS